MASKCIQVTFVIWLLWQMFGLVWHHHEFLIITHWSLMDPLKPPKNGLFRHFCDSFYASQTNVLIPFIKILKFYVSNDVL